MSLVSYYINQLLYILLNHCEIIECYSNYVVSPKDYLILFFLHHRLSIFSFSAPHLPNHPSSICHGAGEGVVEALLLKYCRAQTDDLCITITPYLLASGSLLSANDARTWKAGPGSGAVFCHDVCQLFPFHMDAVKWASLECNWRVVGVGGRPPRAIPEVHQQSRTPTSQAHYLYDQEHVALRMNIKVCLVHHNLHRWQLNRIKVRRWLTNCFFFWSIVPLTDIPKILIVSYWNKVYNLALNMKTNYPG